MLERLLAMLEKGQDSAMLRFSLGTEYSRLEQHGQAAIHFEAALEQKSDYSAAWKGWGRALSACGEHEKAIQVFQQGVQVAEENGDKQAAKEMQVFLKRVRKQQQSNET